MTTDPTPADDPSATAPTPAPTPPAASTGPTPPPAPAPSPGYPPPGYAPPGYPPTGHPQDYLTGGYPVPPPPPTAPTSGVGWVVAGFVLFWPTAIPALLASNRAARALGAGDLPTARAESGRARTWGIVSICVGAAGAVLAVLGMLVWFSLLAVAVGHHRGDVFDGPHWEVRPGVQQQFGGFGGGD